MSQQLIINDHAFFAEERVAKLSLAVLLQDDFAPNKRTIGKVKVSIKEQHLQATQNLSGYYIFMDVLDGDYTIQVISDYYFNIEEEVTLPVPDPRNPVKSITLIPVPYYPFPSGTTLVKGVVKDELSAQPVAGANVRILNPEVGSRTTKKGEFALYFTGLKEQDVIKVNKKKYVKGDTNQNLTLEIIHPDYADKQVNIEVEENKTTSITITI